MSLPPNSPPNLSFSLREKTHKFFQSISTKEPSLADLPHHAPPSLSLPNSPISTPRHHISPSPTNAKHSDPQTTYRCISSVLKKDGQILSIAISKGLVYTGTESNVVRIWKLPEFTEIGQLKTKTAMVVALEICNDKIYAAYGDFKIRIWHRSWDVGVLKHVRFRTIPRAGNYVRSYISGKDKMMHKGPISSLSINIAEDIVYTSSLDKTVKVWRISDLKCIETIEAHSDPINAILIADDGVLYTASDDATVKVWRRNFSHGNRPHSLTITLPAKSSLSNL